MKRATAIFWGGLLLAAVGYCVSFQCVTSAHRAVVKSATPELAWLKKEFQIGSQEFERIVTLHEGYRPNCAEMCRRIAAKNTEIKRLLDEKGTVGPEIEEKLMEASRIRAECQKRMLAHFFAVSTNMPPEQGKRYLAWVHQRTLGASGEMHDPASGHE
jgi:hypothetical protein